MPASTRCYRSQVQTGISGPGPVRSLKYVSLSFSEIDDKLPSGVFQRPGYHRV